MASESRAIEADLVQAEAESLAPKELTGAAPPAGATDAGPPDSNRGPTVAASGAARRLKAWPAVVQRQCAECAQAEDEAASLARRSESGAGESPRVAPPVVGELLRSGAGRRLDPQMRAYFEPRFGRDLGEVRIHTGALADRSARAVNAVAYTVGQDVAFRDGAFAPSTPAGKRLLAHELAHVVQQSALPRARVDLASLQVGAADDALEREADRSADAVLAADAANAGLAVQSGAASAPASAASLPAATTVRRQEDDSATPGSEEPALTRPEEIALSRSTPGEFSGVEQPLALSLFNFGIDLSQPKAEHVAVLTELGRFLNAMASAPITLRIIGFADSTGDAIYNLHLSERRANAVKRVLQPLVSQRISVSAFGETNPAASNETIGGRTRNRRVDIRFASAAPPQPQPLPRPPPVPPGTVPPSPVPPGPVPPGPGPGPGGGGEDHDFCSDYPLLCGIGITPFFLPLVCVVAPELCLAVGCLLNPALCIPPIPPIPPPQPPQPPEPPEDGAPQVLFLPAVRAANTPSGTNDRIGLRDPVAVTALVSNAPPLSAPITIDVDGTGPNGGIATVNGQSQIQITNTTTLQIQGTQMTREGFAFSPFLQLAAWWNNGLIGVSNRFAVSSLAEDWSVALDGVEVTRFGYAFYTKMDWVSDSGSYSHLDALRYVELVDVINETGGMVGLGPGAVDSPDDINTADLHPTFDQHGTPHEYARVAGSQRLKQLWRIRDMRSNSGFSPSRNSGFEIERRFERDPSNPRCFRLVVSKHGAGVTIGGMSSSAGSGHAEHTFRNINCDPPPHDQPPTPEPGPEPEPQPTPAPTHEEPTPAPTTPCDRAELERRVDECIEQAKNDAIDCTLDLIPFGGGIEGIGQGLDYLDCLENMRQALLECDRKAKADTHCPDAPAPAAPQPEPPAPPAPHPEPLVAKS